MFSTLSPLARCWLAATGVGCLSAVAPASASASVSGARWVRPVDGRMVAPFAYARTHPFAAAQRRGADFAAVPGAPVHGPCAGRVTYAGVVPRRGAGVTVRCGALVATVLGLGAASVRRGDTIFAGRRIGIASTRGRVRLGARRAGNRFGYVDPVALLGAHPRPPPPLVPVAPRRVRRAPPPASRPRPLARPARAGAPVRAPLLAWLGVALSATALTAGGAGRVRRRRVASPAPCPSTSPRRSTT